MGREGDTSVEFDKNRGQYDFVTYLKLSAFPINLSQLMDCRFEINTLNSIMGLETDVEIPLLKLLQGSFYP